MSEGEVVRRDSIPGYQATIFERRGNSVRPRTSPAGFSHETVGLHRTGRGSLFAQIPRSPTRGSVLDGRILSVDGEWDGSGPSLPRVMSRRDGLVYTVEADPYPLVREYSVR